MPTARAQVAVVGGGASFGQATGFGLANGFGAFGSQTSFTSGTTLIGTPGINVGAITYGPLGPYTNYYYGSGYGWTGGGLGWPGYSNGFGSPWVGYAPGGYGYWGRGGYWGRPYINGWALPPAVIPAETIYGPGPVRRLMGLDPPLGTSIVNNTTYVNNAPGAAAMPNTAAKPVVPDAGGFGVLGNSPAPPRLRVPATNAAARERAKKQLEVGDLWFRKQQYGDAWIAYKEAARAAPDVADAYFHQAAAAVAQGRYEAAVDSLKYGLRISTAYLDGEFKYSKLYGENVISQTAHLDALAQAAINQPSSDLYFLTGVMLFFDADPLRRAVFREGERSASRRDVAH
ncbi:MAG: hypothetical protein QM775_36600 [Pirellulales bacterium]